MGGLPRAVRPEFGRLILYYEAYPRREADGLGRTDEHGTVTLETDGERLWVDVER